MVAPSAAISNAIVARVAPVLVVASAAVGGLLITTPGLLAPLGVPTSALLGLAFALVAFVIGLRNPFVTLGLFLAWLPVGDLLRKLGNGDPRITLVRDALLALVLLSVTVRYMPWRKVAVSFRGWGLPLSICIGYFVATGVASAFRSWQIPISGLRLYFGSLPLIGVGWALAQDRKRLRVGLIVGSIVVCGATSLGIAHAFIGPSFLAAPTAVGDYFTHLNLERITVGQSAPAVFQPTGPFVEPGRFANWAFINLALGLALFEVQTLRHWRYPVLAIGVVGVFASAGRGIVMSSLLLIAIVVARRSDISLARLVRIGSRVFALLVVLYFAGLAVAPELVHSRTQFLTLSLNPFSASSEIVQRTPTYLRETIGSVFVGGLTGRGLGVQSLGTQYLRGLGDYEIFGEGGFVTIAVETGVIGLSLWIWWTVRWCRNLAKLAGRTDREVAGAVSAVAYAAAMLLFVKFWFGINAIQDFVTNGAFFLACGIAVGLASARPRSDLSVVDQHDLAELPAGSEALVGRSSIV